MLQQPSLDLFVAKLGRVVVVVRGYRSGDECLSSIDRSIGSRAFNLRAFREESI